MSLRRTGKGEWYAILEILKVTDPHTMETVQTAEEKCATREAAVEAGKRLMAEKAVLFGEQTMIEVKIYSALEWSAEQE